MDQNLDLFQFFGEPGIFIPFFSQAASFLEDLLGFIAVVPKIGL